MTRRFFYDSAQNQPLKNIQFGDVLVVPEQIYHHWCKVLRANIGDQATLFDGFGGEYLSELVEVTKKRAMVRLLSFIDEDRTPAITTQIGLVMSRGDRMDYAIQKSTEMGVTAIQLLSSQHGEVRLKSSQITKKLNHWQQVAIAACEQCGMNRIPLILPPLSLSRWMENVQHQNHQIFNEVCDYIKPFMMDDFYKRLLATTDMSLVLAVPKNNEVSATNKLAHQLRNRRSVSKSSVCFDSKLNEPYIRLLIGAEGGLSEEEIALAKSIGFLPWQIGSRVMRTETAPIVALATMQAWMDDAF